jgi:thiosulfate/3-mercaptopyruvate sulfurtransferase
LSNFQSLISADQAVDLLGNADIAIIDCRYDLFDSKKGQQDYQKAHLPGALYAHLKYDLAGPVIPGSTGRHPLPDIAEFTKKLSAWGIDSNSQVIAYDDNSGAMAARLWWLLKWLGHDKVAVLDGGFDHWFENNHPVTDQISQPTPKNFTPNLQNQMLVSSKEMKELIHTNEFLVIDSRAEERYLGITEPIDPVAGHIPGAANRFHKHNVNEKGVFKPKAHLEKEFNKLVNHKPADKVIFYCGSGVTGANNVLAFFHSGSGLAKLYAGSWSEWITDPNRPIELGERK